MDKIILGRYITLLKVYQIMHEDYGYDKEKFIACVSSRINFKLELIKSSTFDKSKGKYFASLGLVRSISNNTSGKAPITIYKEMIADNQKVLNDYLKYFDSIDDFEISYTGINIKLFKKLLGYKEENIKKK